MKKLMLVTFSIFMLTCSALAQEKASDTAALVASMTVLPCATPQADSTNVHQCELRETARLFLIAGQREAALRILCETTPALEVFRPQGALIGGKYEDNIAANHRCLEAVGIK